LQWAVKQVGRQSGRWIEGGAGKFGKRQCRYVAVFLGGDFKFLKGRKSVVLGIRAAPGAPERTDCGSHELCSLVCGCPCSGLLWRCFGAEKRPHLGFESALRVVAFPLLGHAGSVACQATLCNSRCFIMAFGLHHITLDSPCERLSLSLSQV
jgi:hypothetical protein